MNDPNLPADLKRLLTGCPKAGGGVHRWLFGAAMRMHKLRVSDEKSAELLKAATVACGRVVTEQEIQSAVINSNPKCLGNGRGASVEPRRPKWPEVNQERVGTIVESGPRFADLQSMSPVKFTDGKPHCEEIIDRLFPGNPLLCIGQTKYRFNTMPREHWRGLLAARQFIVPSPMCKICGVNKEGKPSKHCLDNTGPRRFLVVEFDNGTFDQHAAFLHHLASFCPLVLAVHSGSKSLHGWFDCSGRDEANLLRFMRYAVSLGADPATWIRSQFVRLPDGHRDNGKRQAVLFFRPSK
jgi:hypothetical protein